MLSLVFVAVLAQKSEMPSNFVGLWADASDRLYMVGTPSYIEYIEGDQWGAIHGVYQAPNQDFVGKWFQSKTLFSTKPWPYSAGDKNWPDTIEKPYSKYSTPLVAPYTADNVRYAGEFRMTMVANGGKFSLFDNKGIVEKAGTMRWIGGWDQARVNGVYKDSLAQLTIRETPGKTNWLAKGEFSYGGKKYLAEGERLYTRGRMNLIDPAYGTAVGQIVYGFAPRPAEVREYRNGNWTPTDTVFVNFTVPNSPTIQQRLLGL
jgi:hypothetical protein